MYFSNFSHRFYIPKYSRWLLHYRDDVLLHTVLQFAWVKAAVNNSFWALAMVIPQANQSWLPVLGSTYTLWRSIQVMKIIQLYTGSAMGIKSRWLRVSQSLFQAWRQSFYDQRRLHRYIKVLVLNYHLIRWHDLLTRNLAIEINRKDIIQQMISRRLVYTVMSSHRFLAYLKLPKQWSMVSKTYAKHRLWVGWVQVIQKSLLLRSKLTGQTTSNPNCCFTICNHRSL